MTPVRMARFRIPMTKRIRTRALHLRLHWAQGLLGPIAGPCHCCTSCCLRGCSHDSTAAGIGTPTGSPPQSPGQAARPPEGHQVPPQEHQEQTERLGQEQNGRDPNLDISTQTFCAGIGQPGLRFANGLPDGPVQDTRQGDRFYGVDGVVLDANTNPTCNIRNRLHDDEITLWIPVGRSRPWSRREPGQRWDWPTRTRVAGTCKPVPVSRE